MAHFQGALLHAFIPAFAIGIGLALRELFRVIGEVVITRRALDNSEPKERAAILKALATTSASRRG